jgi:hypothetical protein
LSKGGNNPFVHSFIHPFIRSHMKLCDGGEVRSRGCYARLFHPDDTVIYPAAGSTPPPLDLCLSVVTRTHRPFRRATWCRTGGPVSTTRVPLRCARPQQIRHKDVPSTGRGKYDRSQW